MTDFRLVQTSLKETVRFVLLVVSVYLPVYEFVHDEIRYASTWSYCECYWQPWESWSDCTSKCFGSRKRMRYVHLTHHDGCEEFEDCAENGGWDYEDCNEVCHNGGYRSGSYCSCRAANYGLCCQYTKDCGNPGSITNGFVHVSKTTYGGWATYYCNIHYRLVGYTSRQTCQSDSTWSGHKPSCVFVNTCASNPCQNQGTCIDGLNRYTCSCAPGWSGVNCEIDIQQPVVSHCSGDIILNATERTLQVNWTEPDISDPFGNIVQVTKNYAHPTFTFPWGDFTVQYHGIKTSNGLSAECTFQVKIRPTPCEDLNIPLNGARVCNGWKSDYGKVCIVACEGHFSLPPSQSYGQLYVCGASGNWIPSRPMPDCSVQVETPDDALVYHPEHFNYSFGSCHEDTAVMEVKQRYIDVLMNSGELQSYCTKYSDECLPDNVYFTCASTNG